MKKRFLSAASSKWNKWKKVRRTGIAGVQPATKLYSRATLGQFLRRYPRVFVKPDRGLGGSDVLAIRPSQRMYRVVSPKGKRSFATRKKLAGWIDGVRRGRRFVIQAGIRLYPLHGSPVDIRTIVQKNERNAWEVTGMFAKVAKRGLAVTNVKAGGRVISVESYLAGIGMSAEARTKLIRKLKRLSVQISQVFQAHYTNRTYALDLGLDHNHRLWLIEVNTHPSFRVLNRVDHRMYHRAEQLRKRKRPS